MRSFAFYEIVFPLYAMRSFPSEWPWFMYNANACVTLVPRYISIVYGSHQRAAAVVASAAKYSRNKAPFPKESLVNPRLTEGALVGQSLLNI